ncbi:MAG: CheR family methyltransferase, partial [Bdellovibrionia bacterium]
MPTLSEPLLSLLKSLLTSQTGLHFSNDRLRDLEIGVIKLSEVHKFSDPNSYIEWILSESIPAPCIDSLVNELTVRETYFYRENHFFEVFEKQILPDFIQLNRGGKKYLKIWSAGCCTGEEPYSMGIALARTISDIKEWDITLLGTDINSNFLNIAKTGKYSSWSFRDPPPWLKKQYFQAESDGSFQVKQEIKKMVTFFHLNLSESLYPSAVTSTTNVDIIFCRNVFIYFDKNQIRITLEKFYQSLAPGGLLIVGPSETSQSLFSAFTELHYDNVVVYGKDPIYKTTRGVITPLESSQPALQPFLQTTTPDISQVFEKSSTQPWVPISSPTQEEHPYERATKLYDQKDYVAAEQIALDHAANCPDVNIRILLAKIYANQKKISQALHWCKEAINADKLNAIAHHFNAIILRENGDISGAIQSLERAIYIDKDFIVANFIYATLISKQGRVLEARRCLKTTLALLSKYPDDHLLPESEGLQAG